VGQTAAEIRACAAEPYKARHQICGEFIFRKEGKKK